MPFPGRCQIWWVAVWALSILAAAGLAAGRDMVGDISVLSGTDLAQFCSGGADSRYIEFPGTRRWLLLRDDGQYSPMPVGEVVEAVSQIDYPLDALDVEIVILPVPRRDVLESSAEGSVIFLSPGRVDYPREHVHYTVAHEIGHVVHHVLMPDSREDLWKEYADLRGLDWDAARVARDHASRLHELFAEDFRMLFGSEMARCGSGVENHDVSDPRGVAGLREFLLSLVNRGGAGLGICVLPNPSNGSVVMKVTGLDGASRIDAVTIFDICGRAVKSLEGSPAGPGEVIWDGTSSGGTTVAPGIYLVAVQSGSHLQIRKLTRLP
jgi:hypothetical protein